MAAWGWVCALTEIILNDKPLMKPFYTHREEMWNSWSHAAGILLGVVFGVVFLYWCFRVRDGWATIGVSLYLLGMVGSYAASTAYHALRPGSLWKERLRKWDHAAIYWHIAGSYSPITLIALRKEGLWGWLLFAFVWACAIGGTISSLRKLKPHSNLETLTYVGMGLSVLVAFKPLLQAVEVASVAWIVAEGVMFVTGAVFYSLRRRRYSHTIFHFFVLAGSLCHIIAVWGILRQFL